VTGQGRGRVWGACHARVTGNTLIFRPSFAALTEIFNFLAQMVNVFTQKPLPQKGLRDSSQMVYSAAKGWSGPGIAPGPARCQRPAR
jgi:hypothetical protein